MSQDSASVRSSPSAHSSQENHANKLTLRSPNGKDPSVTNEEIPSFLKWIAGVRAYLCTSCEMLVGNSGAQDEAATSVYCTSLKDHLREYHSMQVDHGHLVAHTLTLVRYAITTGVAYSPFSPSTTAHERLPLLPVLEKALLCPKSSAASNACSFVALNRPTMVKHYAQAHPNESLPPNLQHCTAQLGFQETYVRVTDPPAEKSNG